MNIINCPHCGKPIDPMAARFAAGAHKYPDLVQAGLGHLWTGPGYNDFADQLVAGARKFLRKHDLPCEKGDAINAIRNKIRARDWGYLEQRHDEGGAKNPPATPSQEESRSLPVAEPWIPLWELNQDPDETRTPERPH